MKKILIALALIPAIAFSQGARYSPITSFAVTGSYAAGTIVGTVFSLTQPKVLNGYKTYIVATTDTVNLANSVRVLFFADTVGFGAVTSGAAFSMSDTMAYYFRGSIGLGFYAVGTTGNSWAEAQMLLPNISGLGKKIYALTVADQADKFKVSGRLRYMIAYDDY